MAYLLDTNACIEVMRGRNPVLKTRLAGMHLRDLSLCSIVWAELHCGVHLSQNPDRELNRLYTAFGNWPRLPFDDAAAESYGIIRADLKRTGQIIGANDLLIAAIAIANNRILITHNTSEFGRVNGLHIEDWQS